MPAPHGPDRTRAPLGARRHPLRAGLVAVALALPAHASTDPIAAVRECRSERDPERRLACFDAATARLPASANVPSNDGAESGAATASSPAPSRTSAAEGRTLDAMTPEQRFGMRGRLAREAVEQANTGKTELDRLTQKVVRSSRNPVGYFIVTLENGQVWAQLATGTPQSIEEGAIVTITPAALGSYVLVGPSGRGARVTRVR